MQFKDDNVKNELHNHVPCFLLCIAQDMDDFCKKHFNKEIVITRVLEFIPGDSSVHESNRAFDVRNEFSGSFYFYDEEIVKIIEYLNSKYKRYDAFTTAIHHSFGGGPYHIHVQIAPLMTSYIPPKGNLNGQILQTDF